MSRTRGGERFGQERPSQLAPVRHTDPCICDTCTIRHEMCGQPAMNMQTMVNRLCKYICCADIIFGPTSMLSAPLCAPLRHDLFSGYAAGHAKPLLCTSVLLESPYCIRKIARASPSSLLPRCPKLSSIVRSPLYRNPCLIDRYATCMIM